MMRAIEDARNPECPTTKYVLDLVAKISKDGDINYESETYREFAAYVSSREKHDAPSVAPAPVLLEPMAPVLPEPVPPPPPVLPEPEPVPPPSTPTATINAPLLPITPPETAVQWPPAPPTPQDGPVPAPFGLSLLGFNTYITAITMVAIHFRHMVLVKQGQELNIYARQHGNESWNILTLQQQRLVQTGTSTTCYETKFIPSVDNVIPIIDLLVHRTLVPYRLGTNARKHHRFLRHLFAVLHVEYDESTYPSFDGIMAVRDQYQNKYLKRNVAMLQTIERDSFWKRIRWLCEEWVDLLPGRPLRHHRSRSPRRHSETQRYYRS